MAIWWCGVGGIKNRDRGNQRKQEKKERNKRNAQIKKIFGQESPNTKTNQMLEALPN